jgi:HAE1 family hydrophobic/amphiphilic exporter-1
MTGLPLAFVGAFGLLLFGNTLNMFSLMGLILPVGIATKNGIPLVDRTRSARAGSGQRSVGRGGRDRLRPI